jgi:hypothetical protein
MRRWLFSAALVATAVAGLGMPPALDAGPGTIIERSLEIGGLTRLAGKKAEEFVLAAARLPPATPAARGRAAVAWTWTACCGADRGLLLSTDAAPIALRGNFRRPLGVAFDDDGNLLFASRISIAGTAVDALQATAFNERGRMVDRWLLGFTHEDGEAVVDFLPDDRAVVAVPGYYGRGTVLVELVGTGPPTGPADSLATTTVFATAGAGSAHAPVMGLRVAAGANAILVGWDRFTPCRGSRRHESVVALLDESLDLVNGAPWLFPSGGCGATGKLLKFLGNSAVGSLALFADGSARRVVNAEPHDFQLPIAEGEAVAAAAMDVNGRLLVVTRTTATQEALRLYVQAYDTEGAALTDKFAVDDTVGGPRFIPEVAAALADDGTAWIAFKRNADNRSGLFLRQLTVRVP